MEQQQRPPQLIVPLNINEHVPIYSKTHRNQPLSKFDFELASMNPCGPIVELLNNYRMGDIVPKNQELVIVFDEFNACSFIAPHRIYACPVVEYPNGRLLGAVTILDFANWLTKFDDSKYDAQVAKIYEGTVKDVIAYSKPMFPHIFKLNDSLLLAAKCFAMGEKYVIFVNDNFEPVNILTQTDLVSFLHNQLLINPKLKYIANFKIENLNLPVTYNVRTISTNASLRDAILILSSKGGSLAIVDEDGKLFANFSPVDLQGVAFNHLNSFSINICRFLQNINRYTLSCLPVVVSHEDTYLYASSGLIVNNLHHLWFIDKYKKPIRCYSLTDHINLAIHMSPKTKEFAG